MGERYPEPRDGESPGPLDALVRLLEDVDATHEEKAIACLGAARTEYRYALADGQVAHRGEWNAIEDPSDFTLWSHETIELLDDVLAEVGDGDV